MAGVWLPEPRSAAWFSARIPHAGERSPLAPPQARRRGCVLLAPAFLRIFLRLPGFGTCRVACPHKKHWRPDTAPWDRLRYPAPFAPRDQAADPAWPNGCWVPARWPEPLQLRTGSTLRQPGGAFGANVKIFSLGGFWHSGGKQDALPGGTQIQFRLAIQGRLNTRPAPDYPPAKQFTAATGTSKLLARRKCRGQAAGLHLALRDNTFQ